MYQTKTFVFSHISFFYYHYYYYFCRLFYISLTTRYAPATNSKRENSHIQWICANVKMQLELYSRMLTGYVSAWDVLKLFTHIYIYVPTFFDFVSFARTFLMGATQIKCMYTMCTILCERNRWQCDLMHIQLKMCLYVIKKVAEKRIFCSRWKTLQEFIQLSLWRKNVSCIWYRYECHC